MRQYWKWRLILNKDNEYSMADVKGDLSSNIHIFHVKSYVEFDEISHDNRLDCLPYLDLEIDIMIAMRELSKTKKKYRQKFIPARLLKTTSTKRAKKHQQIMDLETELEIMKSST